MSEQPFEPTPRAVQAEDRQLHVAGGAVQREFVRLPEFARLLGVSRWTFQRWVNAGVIPAAVNLPGQKRWLRSVAERFVHERTAQPRRFFRRAG
jgi:predicted DNA-binding transcriptional regulator AlpA